MNWVAWVLIGAQVLSSLAAVGTIGKPRKPVTNGVAVSSIIVGALYVWGIYWLAVN